MLYLPPIDRFVALVLYSRFNFKSTLTSIVRRDPNEHARRLTFLFLRAREFLHFINITHHFFPKLPIPISISTYYSNRPSFDPFVRSSTSTFCFAYTNLPYRLWSTSILSTIFCFSSTLLNSLEYHSV